MVGHASVVAHGAHLGEVEDDVLGNASEAERRVHRAQMLNSLGCGCVGRQTLRLIKDAGVAGQVRDGTNGAPRGLGQAHLGETALQRHRVFAIDGLLEPAQRAVCLLSGLHDAPQVRHLPQVHLELAQFERAQGLDGQGNHLRIGLRSSGADKFDPCLGELAPVAGLSLHMAKDIPHVVETQRHRLVIQFGANDASRGDRHVRTESHGAPVTVEETVHLVHRAGRGLSGEGLGILEGRQHNARVPPASEDAFQKALDAHLSLGLFEEQIRQAMGKLVTGSSRGHALPFRYAYPNKQKDQFWGTSLISEPRPAAAARRYDSPIRDDDGGTPRRPASTADRPPGVDPRR